MVRFSIDFLPCDDLLGVADKKHVLLPTVRGFLPRGQKFVVVDIVSADLTAMSRPPDSV